MSRSFLDLCKATVAELGVAGGTGPSSVTGQVKELGRIVQWVGDADLYVQGLWHDWNFLWAQASGTATADTIMTPADFKAEIDNGLVLNTGLASAYRPTWMDWREFDIKFETTPKSTSSRPFSWSVRPDNSIRLSAILSASQDYTLNYFRLPQRMTGNTSVSPIPDMYDRIIIARAKIIYAEREDAPEVMAGSSAEYQDLLEKLESLYLPSARHVRTQRAGVFTPTFG